MLARLRSFLNPTDSAKLPRRIFWVAFVVRILYMTLAHTYRIRVAEDHFQFGWEAGRIARALVTGYGYSDPFANAYLAHSGPTAWLPPLYPLLMAAVFRVFGVYTPASAWILLAINCVLSAATAVATYEIAARCFNRRIALWSAWIWALYPAAMQYAVRWPWEMTLTTALFAWTLVLALRLRNVHPFEAVILSAAKDPSISSESPAPLHPTYLWLAFGLLWGLIALSNATLLIFLPVCGLWILMGTGQRKYALRDATFAALIFLACIAPWTLRNWQAFHVFIPLRGNLGAELCMGNGPGSNGLLMEYDHPFQAPEQLRLYASLGEVRYVAQRGALAKSFIAAHPAHFVADVARRIDFFWISVPHPTDEAWYNEVGRVLNFAFLSLAGLLGLALALRRRIPAAGLFAWAFVLLPIPYYFVTVHARFRHPMEPLICILIVYLFQSAERPNRPSTIVE